jgi:hypothetical protein
VLVTASGGAVENAESILAAGGDFDAQLMVQKRWFSIY